MNVTELLRAGRKSDALRTAEHAVLTLKSARAFADLAHAESSQKNYIAAFAAATKAVTADLEEPAFHFLRCRTAIAAEMFSVAIVESTKTRELCRKLGSEYYVQSAALLAAWGFAQLKQALAARDELSLVTDEVKVMAGRLVTRDLVEHQLEKLNQLDSGWMSMSS